MNNIKIARQILETSMSATDTTPQDFSLFEVKEKFQELLDSVVECSYVDHTLELDCGEVRIISQDHIEDLWTESLIEQIKDCYDLADVPHFVVIDWEETASNCKTDGMGHHFAGYDHEEHESNGFYIFRTN